MSRAAGRYRDGGHRIVLVVDLESGEIDAYGPLPEPDAQVYAAQVALDLDDSGIEDVEVAVVTVVESALSHRGGRGCCR
jgi:hypothetical protein